MATIPYTEILLGIIFFVFLFHWRRNRNSPITYWPVLGMLPGFLWNFSRIHDYVTEVLKQNNGTFVFKGPWFSNLDFVFTSDPTNTNHILSKSFKNYSKGPDFGTIFEPLGDGILAADSDSWKFQRRFMHSYLSSAKFRKFLEKTIQEKVVNGLVPVLDHACEQKMEVNIDDVFQRLGFDIICSLILGSDSKCLSVGFPEATYERAFKDVEEGILYRHFVPHKYWKLLKWLQIGQEKKLSRAVKTIDVFIDQCIASKNSRAKEAEFDFLTACLMEGEKEEAIKGVELNHKFVRDMAVNLVSAGSETSSAALSWFFWLVSRNPTVETKILEEIKENLISQSRVLGAEDVSKLVYLHAALCETLRLYPTVPFNHKCSVLPDTLPSGHCVNANRKILISFYAMGRMEEMWGRDWREFKPERWIGKDGGIVHVPSYKFTAFNAGPRSCLGKDMSFIEMKMVAVAMMSRYKLEVAEDHCVIPNNSVILNMENGLKVRISKASA